MEPDLARFESDNKSKYNFVNVNVDTERAKLERYPEALQALKSAGSIPITMVVDEQGKLVRTWKGRMTLQQLEQEAAALP